MRSQRLLSVGVELFALLVSASTFAAPRPRPEHGSSGGLTIGILAAVAVVAVAGIFVALRGRGGKKGAVLPGQGGVEREEHLVAAPPAAPPGPPVPRTWKEKAIAAGLVDPPLLNNDAGKTLLKEMLGEAAKQIEGGAVAETAEPLPTFALQGTASGVPYRATVELAFGTLQMTALSNKPVTALWVERDMDKVPTIEKPNDPWASMQIKRIFVGKGIFVPGPNQDPNIRMVGNDASDSPSLDERLAAWRRLPHDTQEACVAEMARLELRHLHGHADRITASARATVGHVEDPVTCIVSTGSLLARIQSTLLPGEPAAAAPTGVSTVTCKYCKSLFVLALGATTCPNCGANASA